MPKCLECSFTATANRFNACCSAYHDLCCPKCKTTHIDTADLNLDWQKKGEIYRYGNHNTLKHFHKPK